MDKAKLKEEMQKKAIKKVENAKKLAETLKKNAELAKIIAKNPPPQMIEDIKSTGDIEKDCELELTELQKGFRERAKQEADRFELATDSEYWCAICFQTREQKEVFLAALEVLKHGDKYIDGQVLAKALNIKLPDANVTYNTSSKKDKTWIEFTE